LNLIDRAVPLRHLDAAARYFAGDRRPRRRPGWLARLASRRFARVPVVAMARREVDKRAPAQHYPAPHALLDAWRRHGGDPHALYQAEARSVAHLITTPTS